MISDHIATNRLWRPPADLARTLPPEVAEVLLRAHEELLVGAFDAIREYHGSV